MTGMEILFILFAVIALVAAFMVVTTRNLVHAALWLIVTLFGVAVIYVLLNASFLAVVQVVVYIGAIAILMIFTIMLTKNVTNPPGKRLNKDWWVGGLLSVALFAGLSMVMTQKAAVHLPALKTGFDPVTELGQALVSPNAYVLPFEVASVLLLGALIGAVVVSRKK